MTDTTSHPADRKDLAKITELRIHGVGGASANQLLDAGPEAEIVQVEGDATSGFFRLRDESGSDSVAEAYVWGGLNSRALISGFWWLLLPFTLVNIAGWMLQPSRKERVRPAALMFTRGLVRIAGAGLTVVYVLYLLVLFVDVGAMQCGSDPACSRPWWLGMLRWFAVEQDVGHPVWRAVVGLGIVLGLVGLVFGVSARNRRLHENFGELSMFEGDRSVRQGGLVHRVRGWFRMARAQSGQTTELADPEFWYQLRSPGAQYRLHLGVATMTVGFAAGRTLASATEQYGWPDDTALRWWMSVFAVLSCLLIAVLARPDRFYWEAGKYHDRFGSDDERSAFRLAVAGCTLSHIGIVVAAGRAADAWEGWLPGERGTE